MHSWFLTLTLFARSFHGDAKLLLAYMAAAMKLSVFRTQQTRFGDVSKNITGRMESMGKQLDELEASIGELMEHAGLASGDGGATTNNPLPTTASVHVSNGGASGKQQQQQQRRQSQKVYQSAPHDHDDAQVEI